MEDGVIVPISLEFDESGNAANLSSVKNLVNEVNKILRDGAQRSDGFFKGLKQYPEEVRTSLTHLNSELAASKRNIERYSREVESIQARLKDPKFLYFNGAAGLKDVLVSNQAALQMELDKYTELSQAIRDLQTQETSEGQTAQSITQQEIQAINDRVASYTHLSTNIREAVRQTELLAYKSREYAKEDTSGLAKQYQSYQQILGNMSNILSGKFKEDHDRIKEVQNDIKDLISGIKRVSGEIKDPESRAALKEQISLFRQLQKETKNQGKGDNFGGNFMSRQIYYNLRQLRLFQSELSRIKKNVDNITRSIVSGFGKALKIIGTLALGFTNLRKASDKAKKSTDGFGKGLMSNFWTLLRYTLGIRSLFALMKRFRHALSEGMLNLAKYSEYVNSQMSSVMTSLLYMKNSVATAAQPFLNILAPALEYVSEVVSKLCFNIAQLVAALTGQSFVYKAKRAYVDYAKSMDKAANSAKKMKDNIQDFDKLDIIKTPDDNDSGMPDPNAMFETISPISQAIQDLAKKIKDIVKQFFAPIKKAWNTEGKFVMNAWKYALKEVWKLIKSVGRDFLKMWQEEATVTMWENIFHIVGDIGLIIGNIAKNIRKAWDENERGLHIWEHIRDIVAILIDKMKQLANYAVEWSNNLDFSNLLDSFDSLLVALQPVAKALGQLVYDIVKNVFLEYIQYLIEEGIPSLNKAIESIAKAIHWDQLVANLEPLEKAIEKLMEASFGGFVTAIENVGNALANFVNSKEFAEFLENIADFISRVADSGIIEKIFEAIGLAIEKVAEKLVAFVNSPGFQEFLDGLVEWFNSVSAEDLANALIAIGGGIAALTAVFTIGGWITNFMTFVNTFATFLGFLASAGGPLLIINGLVLAVVSFVEMIKNGWSVVGEILKDLGIALVAIGVIILFNVPGLIAAAVAAIVAVVTMLVALIVTYWEDIKQGFIDAWNAIASFFASMWSGLKQNISNAIQWVVNGVTNLGNLVKTAFSSVVTALSNIWNTIKSLFQSGVNFMISAWTNGFNSLRNIASSVFSGIMSVIRNAVNSVLGFIQAMINGVISGINAMSSMLNQLNFEIPDWVPGIGGGSLGFNIPRLSSVSLPRLAQGAVIPPNKEFMAVLGDQNEGTNIEAPLDTIKQAVAEVLQQMSVGQQDSGDIVVEIDGNEVFRAVRKQNNIYRKSTGKSAFAV